MTDISVLPSHVRERYNAIGVVQVRGVLAADEARRIGAIYTTRVEADAACGHDDHVPANDILARYPRFVHPHRDLESDVGTIARRLMFDPRIFDVVTELIGPAYCAQSMFYFKPPGARGQALHQDNMFLQAHPETCLAAWIAIDDCDAENGGLVVVPGSHRIQLLCPEPADASRSFTAIQVPVPRGVERHQTQMRPGDALFFHGSLVHGSNPNTTQDRFRRSLIFHYVPQASVEIAKFYDPMLAPDGSPVSIAASAEGGPCGEGWEPEPH